MFIHFCRNRFLKNLAFAVAVISTCSLPNAALLRAMAIVQSTSTNDPVDQEENLSQQLAPVAGEAKTKQLETVGRALRFLDSQQAEDGSFSSHAGTGPTSMVVSAMLRHGRNVKHPVVGRGLQFILSNLREDGGIYAEKSIHRNYETALAVVALSDASNGKYQNEIAAADKFLRRLQWDEGEKKEKDDMSYGGAGYGSHTRPDLSNTSFMIDALKAAGAEAGDPDLEKALAFVTRCQNHESATNKTAFATSGPKDGGFFYTAAAGGESKAGQLESSPNGLRSYGSMTYAGLKSLLYAGVKKDDSRVKAAISYLQKHYDLESNPGMGAEGLYYYYHLFAKALRAVGEPTFKSEDGTQHDWRVELIDELASRQLDNGSWLNQGSDRWMEGDPNLVTAYALLALSYTN